MAIDDDDTGAPYGNSADDKIIREAQRRFDQGKEWEADARKHFVDDMRFANGDSGNNWQWDEATRATRADRPCLTVNKTRTHNLQIVNDARQNKASIRISAVGDGATYESAQIFEGVCRHIEYISQATLAYETATYNQVYGGIGYWRVMTDYAHDDTMDQEIFIERVPDPMGIYLDPDIQHYDGSDAKWGIIFRDLTREEFKAEYPKFAKDGSEPIGAAPLNNRDSWNNDTHVRVAEYYRVKPSTDTLHRLRQFAVMPGGKPQADRYIRESKLPDGGMDKLAAMGWAPTGSRDIAEPEIEWFLIAGHTIIDRNPWKGRYIPIVRVVCEEIVIENKLDRISHTRHLRDPQRLYNWYTSSAAEAVALQTKTPYIATAEALENNADEWANANTTNLAVLTYKGTDETGQPVPRPERAPQPVMPQAYMEGLKIAQTEMMMASGQYQAVMGAPSNETSGKAINARQRQGDNATYHVIDHLAIAIRFTGRILIDLIPKIYNTARVMLIMADTGEQSTVHLDPSAPDAHSTMPNPEAPSPAPDPQGRPDPEQQQKDAVKTIWNPNVGRYSVVADVGPSYATKRQQAFDAFSQIMANNHESFAIVGDFWAANADFPGSDQLQARLKLGLPPQYKGGPDPQVVQVQQQAHELLGKADQEVAQLKQQVAQLAAALKDKEGEMSIRDYEAETKRLAATGAIDPDALKLVIREMVSQMIGMPALPVMAEHATAEQAMQPPDPGQMNGASPQQ